MTNEFSNPLSDAQKSRMSEWERASEGGTYKYVTRVDEETDAIARETAAEVVAAAEQKVAVHGIRKVAAKLMGRFGHNDIATPQSRLRELARHELVGNTELAYIEMQSGMMEPYQGNELTLIMARNILSGNYEVVSSTDLTE